MKEGINDYLTKFLNWDQKDLAMAFLTKRDWMCERCMKIEWLLSVPGSYLVDCLRHFSHMFQDMQNAKLW